MTDKTLDQILREEREAAAKYKLTRGTKEASARIWQKWVIAKARLCAAQPCTPHEGT